MARILLVEDDLDVRPLLEYVLGVEGGYEVTAVESVANATALLAAQPFDLVVTDVNLPDGSGLRIADQAKAKGVKVLVLTAHGLSLEPGELAAYDYLAEADSRERIPRRCPAPAFARRRAGCLHDAQLSLMSDRGSRYCKESGGRAALVELRTSSRSCASSSRSLGANA